MPGTFSRRDFLRAASLSAAALACTRAGAAPGVAASPSRGTRAGGTVLFQGDSITDAGRARNNAAPNAALGSGYPLLVAAAVLREAPDASWRFFNRGISGHRVPDLQARWDADTIALAPDVLSILIGVNDYWHKHDGRYNGTTADYETQYAALLADTRAKLPRTRIFVLEPFVLRVGAVNDTWFPEFDERRAAAARVAQRASVTFVPLHEQFQALAAKNAPAYWAADGVHPTPAGHAFIAERWRAATGI